MIFLDACTEGALATNTGKKRVNENTQRIKAGLVCEEEGWQDCNLPRLVVTLKKWKETKQNEIFGGNQNKPLPKRCRRRLKFYHAKDGDRKTYLRIL